MLYYSEASWCQCDAPILIYKMRETPDKHCPTLSWQNLYHESCHSIADHPCSEDPWRHVASLLYTDIPTDEATDSMAHRVRKAVLLYVFLSKKYNWRAKELVSFLSPGLLWCLIEQFQKKTFCTDAVRNMKRADGTISRRWSEWSDLNSHLGCSHMVSWLDVFLGDRSTKTTWSDHVWTGPRTCRSQMAGGEKRRCLVKLSYSHSALFKISEAEPLFLLSGLYKRVCLWAEGASAVQHYVPTQRKKLAIKIFFSHY